jgi:hypothetical protein
MPGGLLSILSYGSTDLFLTGAPQISFFKIVYRRHTNFSIESIEIGLNTNINFEDDYEVIFDRIGDLVGKCYLKIKLPEVYFNRDEFSLPYTPYNDTPNTDLNNYNTVKTYMNYNMKAYRVATDDVNVKNMTITKFLTDIGNQFAGDGQTAWKEYTDLRKNQYHTEKIYSIMYNASIYDIYLNYNANISNLTNSDIPKIYKEIEFAVTNSVDCIKYFWGIYEYKYNIFTIRATNNLKFAWNKNIGHNLIDNIKATLGGEEIDKHYGNLFELNYQLTHRTNFDRVYDKLIGNLPELTLFNELPKPSYIITVPLNFWFNRNMGSAFPLIASQYSDLAIKMKLRNINQCGLIESVFGETYSLEDLWNDKNYKLEVSLLVDYIFLDGQERKKFAQSSHEYLIENYQTVTYTLSNLQSQVNQDNLTNDSIINNTISMSVDLDLKHPCKQFIWSFQKEKYLDDKNGLLKCIYNNYSVNIDENKNPLKNANLTLNGYDRMNKKLGTGDYYNLIQPYQHNTNIPITGIYAYSFSIFPEELQPSGACNFTRFGGQSLNIDIDENMFYYANSDLDPNIISLQKLEIEANEMNDIDIDQDIIESTKYKKYLYTDVVFNLFAKGYNVIRINGGFSGLAFSFN